MSPVQHPSPSVCSVLDVSHAWCSSAVGLLCVRLILLSKVPRMIVSYTHTTVKKTTSLNQPTLHSCSMAIQGSNSHAIRSNAAIEDTGTERDQSSLDEDDRRCPMIVSLVTLNSHQNIHVCLTTIDTTANLYCLKMYNLSTLFV